MLGRAEGASRVDARGWLGLFPSRSPCPEPFGFAQDRLRRMDQDDHVSQVLSSPHALEGCLTDGMPAMGQGDMLFSRWASFFSAWFQTENPSD